MINGLLFLTVLVGTLFVAWYMIKRMIYAIFYAATKAMSDAKKTEKK